MTAKEAVEYMGNEVTCINRKCNRSECDFCNLAVEERPLLEAFGMAIEALKKQIPTKRVGDKHPHACPTCHCIQLRAYDYCYNCGQAFEEEQVENEFQPDEDL